MKTKRTRFKHYLMSPYKNSRSIVFLRQIGNASWVKPKQALVYTPKPKYQFYPRGNIKDRRDLGRGWIFWTPLPLSKRQFKPRLCQFLGQEGSF